ncbi:hypothetical protein TRFO_31678 [Tritrichomonas foetus]|uniref:Thioredoxin domain-containing protein n=1 Tax=Tritrichomonas foetus TaxID=1144522 RepID=A0A1J4JRW1_9EUKA|nr:hypothetical protein TRFO_31678 [Tritrichomonas foetus]|eukprot:OHT01490.1 hypothetical protein TRFO_31678 [Tritrichomonas foetus]
MVFYFLAGLTLSVYIPHQAANSLSIEFSGLEKAQKLLKENENVIAFVGAGKDVELIMNFASAEPLFPEYTFIHIYPREMKNIVTENDTVLPEDPYFAIFKNGNIVEAVGPIDEDSSLLFLLDLYVYGKRPLLKDQKGLVSSLGQAPLTIIAPESKYEEMKKIAKISTSEFVLTDVIQITQEVANEVSLVDGSCALYRKLDKSLEEFNCTIEGLRQGRKPLYSRPTVKQMKESTKPAVCFCQKKKRENLMVGEFLYTLAKHFHNEFDFFELKSDETKKYLGEFLGDSTICEKTSNLAVINVTGKFFYRTTQFLPRTLIEAPVFDAQSFTTSTAQLLNYIKSNQVDKIPISEPIPKPSSLAIKKVVGKNYKEFVMEEGKDVLVLFVKPNSKACQFSFTALKEVAEDLIDVCENEFIKFGFMDYTANQIDGGLPVVPDQPAIIFYPANQKLSPKFVIGKRVGDILMHIRLFAAKKPITKLNETLSSMDEFNQLTEYFRSVIPQMNRHQKNTLEETIRKVKVEYEAYAAKNQNETEEKEQEL